MICAKTLYHRKFLSWPLSHSNIVGYFMFKMFSNTVFKMPWLILKLRCEQTKIIVHHHWPWKESCIGQIFWWYNCRKTQIRRRVGNDMWQAKASQAKYPCNKSNRLRFVIIFIVHVMVQGFPSTPQIHVSFFFCQKSLSQMHLWMHLRRCLWIDHMCPKNL